MELEATPKTDRGQEVNLVVFPEWITGVTSGHPAPLATPLQAMLFPQKPAAHRAQPHPSSAE